jgi:hypothetical protein
MSKRPESTEDQAVVPQPDVNAQTVPDRAPPGVAPPRQRDLVTREQLGRLMGKHERTIRRWERNRLAPAVLVGEDGTHRFDLAHVRELVEVREGTQAAPHCFEDGETTAQVFDLFAGGVEPVEVVMRLRLAAAAVDVLRRQWAALRGGYVVDRETARAICALRGETILDGQALLKSLREVPPRVATGATRNLAMPKASRVEAPRFAASAHAP